MSHYPNPYDVLGLDRGASKDEAKAKFKSLAKGCHPDLFPNDPEKEKRFKEINEAYDRIKSGDTGPEFTSSESFRDFDFPGAFTHFSDIFGFEARNRNSDLHLECPMTLEEAFEGKTLNIRLQNRTVTVVVPPGIRNGMRLSVAKGGNQSNMTMPPGDLYVTIRVSPHTRFRLDPRNNNMFTTVPVTVFDVMLGRSTEIESIDGKILTLGIPPGFDSSRKLRLAGQGMPDPHSMFRGDLFVDLLVSYPNLTDEQMELIRKAEALKNETSSQSDCRT